MRPVGLWKANSRVGYGPFNLGDLPRGQAVELKGKPVDRFLADLAKGGAK